MSYLGTKPANQITDSTLIADGVITTADLADGAITTAKIAAGAVVAEDIANGAVTRAKMGYAGAVLQVVQTVKSDTFTTSSTSFTDITGLSVSITPTSASNRILVSFNTQISMEAGYYSGGIRLVRNSTSIYLGNQIGNRTPSSGWAWSDGQSYTMNTLSGYFLDSPATTSATTYKLQLVSGYSGFTVYLNRSAIDANFGYIGRVPSQITVMEIAG